MVINKLLWRSMGGYLKYLPDGDCVVVGSSVVLDLEGVTEEVVGGVAVGVVSGLFDWVV